MVNVDSWWDVLVRGRFQAVLELVLAAIADDPVTIEIILKIINEWDPGCDAESWPARSVVPVSRPEVIKALRELTGEDYAQACNFAGQEIHRVDFRDREVAEVWFSATRKGINAVRQLQGSE